MAFASLYSVRKILTGLHCPWFFAGGWALDLFLGRPTREHHDIDIVVFRTDQKILRGFLRGWDVVKIIPGAPGRTAWGEREILSPPIHEIHAESKSDRAIPLEFLLNEKIDDQWVFRRNPEVSFPCERIGHRFENALPYLRPEIVLLYKAKNPGAIDESDFERVRTRLAPEGGQWLLNAIMQCHPDHPWLSKLRRS